MAKKEKKVTLNEASNYCDAVYNNVLECLANIRKEGNDSLVGKYLAQEGKTVRLNFTKDMWVMDFNEIITNATNVSKKVKEDLFKSYKFKFDTHTAHSKRKAVANEDGTTLIDKDARYLLPVVLCSPKDKCAIPGYIFAIRGKFNEETMEREDVEYKMYGIKFAVNSFKSVLNSVHDLNILKDSGYMFDAHYVSKKIGK